MSKALTAAAVDKLKPDPGRRLEIPDGLLVGLYLVVQTSGKKSWAVRFRVGGKPKKLTLGRFPAMTLRKRERSPAQLFVTRRRELIQLPLTLPPEAPSV